MKRIAFALCATCISLCTMAQGNLEKGLYSNPKIESLVSEVKALGGNPKVYYNYDGKLHKTVMINFPMTNESLSMPTTGDPKRDAMNQKLDSIRKSQFVRDTKMYDAVRNTCKALTDDAKESYTWEYHRNGADSVRYAIAIGEYQDGEAMAIYRNQRDVYYYNAPELISFNYNSFPSINGGQMTVKGFADFRYEYTPDSVFKDKKDILPLDKEAYNRLIQPILKQEGITSRQFYVYHDSTYILEKPASKSDYDKNEFVMRECSTEPKQPKSETRGTVYTLHSRAQADAVLAEIKKVTSAFIDSNPGFWFTFHPYNDYGKMQLSEFFESVYLSRVPDTYRIYLHSAGEQEFNIIVVESQGDMMIPTEWAVMKSWNNGKVTYDKKALKNLTPEQAREKTSAHRIISTRQFEPYE